MEGARDLSARRHGTGQPAGGAPRLPQALTSLVGREQEVSAVVEFLRGHRLVALTGTGGVGKTRVAMAVVQQIAAIRTRVWWVDAAPVWSGDRLRTAVVAQLGAAPGSTPSVASCVASAVGDSRALLVLDSCEHLLDEAALVVTEALGAAPGLSVLVTSREPIGMLGETVWRVPSLSLLAPGALETSPSVELFLQRARDVRPDLVVDEVVLATVAAVCERLDGIPLAIELAAARCRHLSPSAVLDALDDRFRLLAGGDRPAVPRHRTMRLSLDWSYQLLDDDERTALRALSVFRGRFPLAAAAAVVEAVSHLGTADATETVERLVDKSMVGFDGERYGLLDTVRAYGADLSAVAERDAAREAHAVWCAAWLAGAVSGHRARAADAEIAGLEPDLLAALEWSAGRAPRRAAGMAEALAGFWFRRARWTDVATVGLAALDAVRPVDQACWAAAACALAHTAVHAGCAAFLEDDLPEAIEVAEATGRPTAVAQGHLALAYRNQSWAHAAAALDAARAAGDDALVVGAAVQLCIVGLATADPATARDAVVALDAWRPPARSSTALAVGMARAYADFTAGMIVASGQGFRPFVALGADAGPTIETVAAVAACMLGVLAADGELARLGLEVIRRARSDRRVRSPLAATLEWVVDPTAPKPDPEAQATSGVANSLWCGVGALALLDDGDPDGAFRVLAARPAGEAPGSFLAVTAAAVRASVAQLAGDHTADREWRGVLAAAAAHGYRALAVDAFEALAARAADPVVAGRLLGAADGLRDATGYRHRFAFQQAWVDEASTVADPQCRAEAAGLDWYVVAEWVQRSWGDRHRPTSGWASLTPTERRVVELTAQGRTNGEIAAQLLMSRATVKTHLAHVFAKLGVRTRTELVAAQLANAGH